ncbi:MAG: zinc ribbon domain-containing protein [Haliscomenobacter sp.]|nr:zinc ribbon domain-containing protein [Haliscomenobacter sp.]MBK8654743.1 zinc ribbon domain-containing protein [Haliscomenobacter sp.]
MPMDQDPNHGGTNADGSKNAKYCSYCLVHGQFADGFKTSGEMAAFVRGKLKEMGYGWLKRWFFSSHISQLERWKKPA